MSDRKKASVSSGCDKHHEQETLREERVYSALFMGFMRKGSQGRKFRQEPMQRPWRSAAFRFALIVVCSAGFIIQPRATVLGMGTTQSGLGPPTSNINLMETFSQLRFFFPNNSTLCQVYKNKTKHHKQTNKHITKDPTRTPSVILWRINSLKATLY